MLRAHTLVIQYPKAGDPMETAPRHEHLLNRLAEHFEESAYFEVAWEDMRELGFVPRSPVVTVSLLKPRRGENIPLPARGWRLVVPEDEARARGMRGRLDAEIKLMEWLLEEA